eukprot:EG_transcript_57845
MIPHPVPCLALFEECCRVRYTSRMPHPIVFTLTSLTQKSSQPVICIIMDDRLASSYLHPPSLCPRPFPLSTPPKWILSSSQPLTVLTGPCMLPLPLQSRLPTLYASPYT